jgi:hypothetical protein
VIDWLIDVLLSWAGAARLRLRSYWASSLRQSPSISDWSLMCAWSMFFAFTLRSFLSFATLFVQTLEKTVFVLHDNKECRFAATVHSTRRPATVHSARRQHTTPHNTFPSWPAHGLRSVLHSPGPDSPAGLCLHGNSSPGAQVLPSSVFDSLSSLQFVAFDRYLCRLHAHSVAIPQPQSQHRTFARPPQAKHRPRLFHV